MATNDVYYPGGFVAAAPAKNLKSRADSVAGTFTAWDSSGNQTSQRPLTAAETAFFVEDTETTRLATNQETIIGKAKAALAANNTFLAIASPTAAQVSAQVKLLTRENNAIVRLLLNDMTNASDT
jgi:hypothetical protein